MQIAHRRSGDEASLWRRVRQRAPRSEEGHGGFVDAGVHAPYWVGMEKGFFKDAGYDVSWREVASSVDRVTVVSQGDAVMAGTGSQAIVAVMGRATKNFYWVGSPIPPRIFRYRRAWRRQDVRDLKGKKLAIHRRVGEIVDYYLLNTVARHVQGRATRQLEAVGNDPAHEQGLSMPPGRWYPNMPAGRTSGTRKIASVADLGFWEKYRQIPHPMHWW